jgi:hypothetical protein
MNTERVFVRDNNSGTALNEIKGEDTQKELNTCSVNTLSNLRSFRFKQL